MQVSEIMSRQVFVANMTTTSRDAAKRMRDEHIGAMPVVPVEEPDRPVGMVTDRDIVVRAVAENRLPSNAAVSTVMSDPLICRSRQFTRYAAPVDPAPTPGACRLAPAGRQGFRQLRRGHSLATTGILSRPER